MTHVDFLHRAFAANASNPALVWRDRETSYGELTRLIAECDATLEDAGVGRGAVTSLEADFSPTAVAMLLALIERSCVVVPLTSGAGDKLSLFRQVAQVETRIVLSGDDAPETKTTGLAADHPLIERLREQKHPGLILFSSGSTGDSKASLHDFVPLLEKFRLQRHCLRTLAFLLFDHIGGINTLLYSLANGGCVVTVQDRRPDPICAAIEKHDVQLLPTSPTFLNLLLVSEAYRRHDLGSLETITYGTEVMPAGTLERLHRLLPGVRLLQTYGLSEVGILRSRSRSADSLWVKVGGEGFATRVVDGMLQIKADSAMLGYLNAPDPFTPDGWLPTGDVVDVDGDYIRIRGRNSEIINVGGEKVYPAEVESVLQAMPGVADAVVAGQPNAITGHIVTARIRLASEESAASFRQRMHRFCKGKLARYMIPQKVELVSEQLHSERFKKLRGG